MYLLLRILFLKLIREVKAMDTLVKKLSTGKHMVMFEPRSDNLEEIKERLEQGFVFVKFMKTQGGTELGIDVDSKLTCIDQADFINGTGSINVVGNCELNFHKVRCIAEIDLATREGLAHLEVL